MQQKKESSKEQTDAKGASLAPNIEVKDAEFRACPVKIKKKKKKREGGQNKVAYKGEEREHRESAHKK